MSLPPRPNLAGEVEILVKWRWVGTTELISTAKTAGLHATTAKSAFFIEVVKTELQSTSFNYAFSLKLFGAAGT